MTSIVSNSEDFVGVILAAGIGSRLRPITKSLPKCMVKTAGRPLLEYQFDAYRNAGITELVVVVGYEGLAIRNYCKHIKDLSITIVENADYEITNNMYSFYLARKYIGRRPFILNNADLVVDQSIISTMLSSPDVSAVAIDSSVFNNESMKVSVNQANFICDISKSIPNENSAGCSIDFYKFSLDDGQLFIAEVIKIIEIEKNLKDWTEVALQRAFRQQKLRFSIIDVAGSDWVEIDNYDDLAIADRKFSRFDVKLADIQVVFLDLDGTVYIGDKVVAGASDVILQLRQSGKRVYFLSNNSSKNKSDYVSKLKSMGITVSEEDIVLSTDAVIDYLNDSGCDKVHVLGTVSLKKVFLDAGFRIDVPDPEYVVIGYDSELNYEKLIAACEHINKGVDIIATHCDLFCPSENGPIPDIGSLIQMIQLTTGKSPVKTFGKPNTEMVKSIVRKLAVEPKKILFVGDRLHTDVQMAVNLGSPSLLVLTGDTTRDDVQASSIQPTFILRSIAEMIR